MAAPSLIFFPQPETLRPVHDFEAENGDTAINEWWASGTHTGPLEGPDGAIPATGKSLTLRGCDVITVQDGLIQSQRVYFDQLSFLAQLGLIPEGAVTPG